jgi:hypothetical protein
MASAGCGRGPPAPTSASGAGRRCHDGAMAGSRTAPGGSGSSGLDGVAWRWWYCSLKALTMTRMAASTTCGGGWANFGSRSRLARTRPPARSSSWHGVLAYPVHGSARPRPRPAGRWVGVDGDRADAGVAKHIERGVLVRLLDAEVNHLRAVYPSTRATLRAIAAMRRSITRTSWRTSTSRRRASSRAGEALIGSRRSSSRRCQAERFCPGPLATHPLRKGQEGIAPKRSASLAPCFYTPDSGRSIARA